MNWIVILTGSMTSRVSSLPWFFFFVPLIDLLVVTPNYKRKERRRFDSKQNA
jgi:hypothetical protein